MQDLTTGSISRHLAKTTGFMLVMMVFQTLYFLVDLYWVGRLGTAAVAGVAVAGNLTFIVLALGQMLGVGTTTVIAHAAGRRDQPGAQHLFNQSQLLAVVLGGGFLAVAMLARPWYARAMAADAATARLASDYLRWFIPAMALQFPLGAMGAALRGIGLFKPGVLVSTVSVILNMVLAPFLIFGWGTGHAYGVQGAAMSSLVSIAIAIAWMATYFAGPRAWIRFEPRRWVPELPVWRHMLGLGLPAGFEFAMMAVYQAVVYTVSRPFGAAAQAGFGIGMRVIQAGFMPVVALGMSVAPVAAQNVGARLAARVKATWRDGVIGAVVAMSLLLLACQLLPAVLVRPFAKDPAVVAFGADYLRIVSLGFIASGVIFVTSSMFQAMGNTMPSLFASGTRMVLLAFPLVLLVRQPGFRLAWIWYLSIATTHVQLLLVLWMLRREYAKRLDFGSAAPGRRRPGRPSPRMPAEPGEEPVKNTTKTTTKAATRATTIALALLTVAACAARPRGEAMLAGAPAGAAAGLAQLRAATRPFQDLDAAVAAGYPRAVAACIAHEHHGAMGYHHVNRALMDRVLDPAKPEILLYERTPAGEYRLTGAEFIVPFRVWPRDSVAPVFMGQVLKREENLKYWYLHAWAWKENPDGVFADFHPGVRCDGKDAQVYRPS